MSGHSYFFLFRLLRTYLQSKWPRDYKILTKTIFVARLVGISADFLNIIVCKNDVSLSE